jgi:putative membrane protein
MTRTPSSMAASRCTLALAALAAMLAVSACKNHDESIPSATNSTSAGAAPAGTTPSATGDLASTGTGTSTTAGASPSADNSHAIGTSGTMSAGTTPLPAPDAQFVTHAAEDGQFEVAIGKLAAEKATDPAIKSFAQMLVDDHNAANTRLRQIATSHDVALPAALPDDKKKEVDQLSKLSGAEFDREFVNMVGIQDHRHDIADFERASRDAKSDDVKGFAQSTLPTLKKHLAAAEKLPTKG